MLDKLPENKRVKRPEHEASNKEDECLDEALYESFPASDPPAVVQKGEPTAPSRGAEIDRKERADKINKE